MILVVIPNPDMVDIVRKAIIGLKDRIRSVVCVTATRQDEDVCSVLMAMAKKIIGGFETVPIDDVDKITIYSEVYMMPLGMKSLIASVSYNLGRSGTDLKLVYVVGDRIKIASGKTMRIIETI